MGIKFSETGRKLRDGVIPAGTTVWKKARIPNSYGSEIVELITLEDGIIPTDLRYQTQSRTNRISPRQGGYRASTNGYFRKCRVPKAYVVSTSNQPVLYGDHDFEYKVGTVVVPDSFDSDQTTVCTHGIHVFLTKEEAEAYNLT